MYMFTICMYIETNKYMSICLHDSFLLLLLCRWLMYTCNSPFHPRTDRYCLTYLISQIQFPTYLPIYLSAYISTYLFTYIYIPVYLTTYLSIYMSTRVTPQGLVTPAHETSSPIFILLFPRDWLPQLIVLLLQLHEYKPLKHETVLQYKSLSKH